MGPGATRECGRTPVSECQVAAGPVTEIAGAEGWYEHLLSGGTWYIHGKDDGILSTKKPLCAVRGRAKVGQPAKDLMQSGDHWLPWTPLTEDSIVTGECKAMPRNSRHLFEGPRYN
jgi:hypothetical protein